MRVLPPVVLVLRFLQLGSHPTREDHGLRQMFFRLTAVKLAIVVILETESDHHLVGRAAPRKKKGRLPGLLALAWGSVEE